MKTRNRRSGYTLLELVISLGLMTVVGGGVIMTSARGLAAVESGNAIAAVNSQTARAMTRIMSEVEALGATSLAPDLVTLAGMPTEFSESIEFRSGIGWQAGAILWGTTTRIAFVTDENEVENGLDDDGDGFVDEGSIVLTLNVGDADERSVTFASGVRGYAPGELRNGLDDNGNGLADERGLVFTRNGSVLSIEVTMEGSMPDGAPLVRSLQDSIRIRN